MNVSIYLDESGDLGWKLDAPYTRGGSSRYFTLAAVIIPSGEEAKIERIVRGLYKSRNRPLKNELKSVELRAGERLHFSNQVAALKTANEDVLFTAITIDKEKVSLAFKRHQNGLYNYMIKTMLLKTIASHANVSFIPDARSIKTELKHALADYLLTELAIINAATNLVTTPSESKHSLSIQFADILSGIVWAQYEFPSNQPKFSLLDYVQQEKLF